MTNKDIMKALIDIECALFYRVDGSDNPENVSIEGLTKAHDQDVMDTVEWWKRQ